MTDRPSSIVGLVIVRGAGAPMVQWRLPRRTTAGIGRRDRHALPLAPEWVPLDLAACSPVEDGWLLANPSRSPVKVETEWVQGGEVRFKPGAVVMLQRGEHRVTWLDLDKPVAVSVSVRTRRLDDNKIPYAVDGTVADDARTTGSYLGIREAPMSAALRYRLAVLYRHLIEGQAQPPHALDKRAQFLRMTPHELEELAHRHRRRLNAIRKSDLQDLGELGRHLVDNGELTKADLDP